MNCCHREICLFIFLHSRFTQVILLFKNKGCQPGKGWHPLRSATRLLVAETLRGHAANCSKNYLQLFRILLWLICLIRMLQKPGIKRCCPVCNHNLSYKNFLFIAILNHLSFHFAQRGCNSQIQKCTINLIIKRVF